MSTCNKCGAPLLPESNFCTSCGSPVQGSARHLCPNCGAQVAEDSAFCNQCGERVNTPVPDSQNISCRARTILISRDTQLQCIANTYKVIVNGTTLGNVPPGGALRTRVNADTATVDIICTTIMSKERRHLLLKLGENPRISFKRLWPGMILETVYDAQILERQ